MRGDYSSTIEGKEKVTVTGLMTNFWFIHSLEQLWEKLGKYVMGQVGKPHKLWPQQLSPHKGVTATWGWEKNSKSATALPLVPQCHTLRVSWDESQQSGFKAELAGTNTSYQGAESSPCCRIRVLVPPQWANHALLEQGFMEKCQGNEERAGRQNELFVSFKWSRGLPVKMNFNLNHREEEC